MGHRGYGPAMTAFLLIHGAGHGGWCWDAVSGVLRGRGYRVVAPDMPCEDVSAGLDDYARVAVAALDGSSADVVVVGHSLGGLVVPLVASRVTVRRVVFVAGIIGAPDASLESLAEVDADRDRPMQDEDLEADNVGRFRFTASGARRLLFHDCPPEVADAAIARLRYQRSLWTEVAHFGEWPRTEVVSVVCADDRVVNPEWADRVARERLRVEPVHLPGGHSPFLSRPAELAEVLTDGL